ncbi:MAG: hypothetical protein Q6373_018280 [Candidatus Sigynarchaeota archaeon]
MSSQEQGWKEYADPSPLVLKFDLKKGSKDIKPVMIVETKYRKKINEQMGLVKPEYVIEIRHEKNSLEHAFGLGMVSADSPQAKHVKHLSSAEKIEATRKFFIDKTNDERLGQLFGASKQGIAEIVTSINTGKFTIVKEEKTPSAKTVKGTTAKAAKNATAKSRDGNLVKKAKNAPKKKK